MYFSLQYLVISVLYSAYILWYTVVLTVQNLIVVFGTFFFKLVPGRNLF